MSIFEYDEEKHNKFLRQEGFEDGLECGLAQGMERGLAQGMEQGLARGMEQGLAQGMKRGLARGKSEGIIELLEELGEIPEQVKEVILSEASLDTLKNWNKLAARADSIEDFMEVSGIMINN